MSKIRLTEKQIEDYILNYLSSTEISDSQVKKLARDILGEKSKSAKAIKPLKGIRRLNPNVKLFSKNSQLRDENTRLKNKLYNELSKLVDDKDKAKERFLKVEIFLDTDEDDDIREICEKIEMFIELIDFGTVHSIPAKRGSWYKKLYIKSKKFLTKKEVQEKLEKIEYGITMHGITKTQSEIDKNQAEAVSTILKAAENTPNLATKIGSLLILKVTDENNNIVTIARNLSLKELIQIEKYPELMSSPAKMLQSLNILGASSA